MHYCFKTINHILHTHNIILYIKTTTTTSSSTSIALNNVALNMHFVIKNYKIWFLVAMQHYFINILIKFENIAFFNDTTSIDFFAMFYLLICSWPDLTFSFCLGFVYVYIYMCFTHFLLLLLAIVLCTFSYMGSICLTTRFYVYICT